MYSVQMEKGLWKVNIPLHSLCSSQIQNSLDEFYPLLLFHFIVFLQGLLRHEEIELNHRVDKGFKKHVLSEHEEITLQNYSAIIRHTRDLL